MVLNFDDFASIPSPNPGHLVMSGDIFGCHKEMEHTTGFWYVEARDATKDSPSQQRTIRLKMSAAPRLKTPVP